MSSLVDKIRSRGHWNVVIRPNEFKKDRIEDITQLLPIVRDCSVSLRGWDFPHVDHKQKAHIDIDWVEQLLDWNHHVELWRMYQSGQFVFMGGLFHDWVDQSELMKIMGSNQPQTFVSLGDSIYRYTEIFEFASRLALSDAGSPVMHIELSLSGIKDRVLREDTANWVPYDALGTIGIDCVPSKIEISREDLIAQPREYALEAMIELFRRFNWNPRIELLRDLQQSLLR